MAQSSEVRINIDVSAARKKLRSLLALTRDVNAELARLDVELEALEARAADLAEFGISLEVKA